MSPKTRKRMYALKNSLSQVIRDIEFQNQCKVFQQSISEASILLMRYRKPDVIHQNPVDSTFSAMWRLDADREFWIDSNFPENKSFFSIRLPNRQLEASVEVSTTEYIVTELAMQPEVIKKLVSLLD